MKTLVIILTLTFNLSSLYSQSGWYLSNNGLGTQTSFFGIYFNDYNTGYICGDAGEIFKTTNSGINWILLNTGTSIDLCSIKFINQNTGICVGDSGLILKTTNAGLNWYRLNSNTNQLLMCIRFLNNNFAMVAGYEVMLKTTDCGVTWASTILPSTLFMRSVFPVNENISFAAGYVNFIFAKILKTTNGGISWDSLSIPFSNFLYDIYFVNMNTGYAAGTNTRKLMKTTNSGLSWTLTNASLTAPNTLQCFGPDTIYVAGGPDYINTYGASISTNGGITWIGQYTLTYHSLIAIHMINSSTGFLSGNNGVVLKTTTSGLTEVISHSNSIPYFSKLYQNYPNPFNPSTMIKYDMPKDAVVEIKIYDILGKQVFGLDEFKKAGSYEVRFDGTNLASGMYFYSVEFNGFKETKKMVLLK